MSEPIIGIHDRSDDMNESQIAFINSSRGRCPFCKEGALISGPSAGMNCNFRCDQCGQEMNLAILGRNSNFIVYGHVLHRKEPDYYGGSPLSALWTT